MYHINTIKFKRFYRSQFFPKNYVFMVFKLVFEFFFFFGNCQNTYILQNHCQNTFCFIHTVFNGGCYIYTVSFNGFNGLCLTSIQPLPYLIFFSPFFLHDFTSFSMVSSPYVHDFSTIFFFPISSSLFSLFLIFLFKIPSSFLTLCW